MIKFIKFKFIDGIFLKDFFSGTYYFTGSGLFIDDYGSIIYLLDGYGYVRVFEVDGFKGEVRFLVKYVKIEV